MIKINVSKSGIQAMLKKLDPRKSRGPDNLSAIVLKMFAIYVPSFLDCVCHLIQASIEAGKVPRIWRHADITPIYKGGD